MNRRVMMTSAVPAAAYAFSAGAAPAGLSAEDLRENEMMQLYSQYLAITDAAAVHPSVDDDELERLFYLERDAIEERMMALPCTSARDLAIKFLVSHCFGDLSCLYEDAPVWNEARELVGGLVRAEAAHVM